MAADLRAVKHKLTVYKSDGTSADFSNCLLSYTGSDSKIDTSGIVAHTGTIELGEIYKGTPEPLDDRLNPSRWARGNKIILDITNDAGSLVRHPRGTLRILRSSYNPITHRLSLEVGDILTLLDFKQPESDQSKINLGTGKTRTALINQLLTYAGAPTISSGPTDTIDYPIPNFSGQYIQQAGAIAFAAGYFLWVDNQENIRCDRIILRPDSVLYTYNLYRDVARYERLTGSEKPCEIVRCLGNTQFVTDISNPLCSTQENYSTKGALFPWIYPNSQETILESRITTCIYWDAVNQIETTEVKYELPLVSSYRHSAWAVTTRVNLAHSRTDTTKKYFDSLGRLSRTEHEDARLPGQWVVFAASGTNQSFIVGAKDTTNYYYDDNDVLTKIERLEYQLLKTLLTGVGFSRFNYNDTNNVYFKLVPYKKTTETWTAIRIGCWRYETRSETSSQYLQGQQLSAVDAQNTTSFTTTESRTETSSSGQCNPPATEYQRPPADQEQKDFVGEARFISTSGNSYTPRRRDYQIDYATNIVQLEAIALELGGLLYGRDKGQQIDVELSDALISDYKPLARHNVYEGSGVTNSFLLDGCSWVLASSQCKLSSDSIWIGTAQTVVSTSVNTTTNIITV